MKFVLVASPDCLIISNPLRSMSELLAFWPPCQTLPPHNPLPSNCPSWPWSLRLPHHLRKHAHVPVVMAHIMNFIWIVLPASSSLRQKFSNSNLGVRPGRKHADVLLPTSMLSFTSAFPLLPKMFIYIPQYFLLFFLTFRVAGFSMQWRFHDVFGTLWCIKDVVGNPWYHCRHFIKITEFRPYSPCLHWNTKIIQFEFIFPNNNLILEKR